MLFSRNGINMCCEEAEFWDIVNNYERCQDPRWRLMFLWGEDFNTLFLYQILMLPNDYYLAKQRSEKSRLMTKPTKWPVRPAKTQISLGIRPVWQSLRSTLNR